MNHNDLFLGYINKKQKSIDFDPNKFSCFAKEEGEALQDFFSEALTLNPNLRPNSTALLQHRIFSFIPLNYIISPTESAIVAKECRNKDLHYYKECIKLYEKGDLLNCLSLCEQKIKYNGENYLRSVNLYLLKIKILLFLEEYNEAYRLIEELFKLQPDLPPESRSDLENLYILYLLKENCYNQNVHELIQNKFNEFLKFLNNVIVDEHIYFLSYILFLNVFIYVNLNSKDYKRIFNFLRKKWILFFSFSRIPASKYLRMICFITII